MLELVAWQGDSSLSAGEGDPLKELEEGDVCGLVVWVDAPNLDNAVGKPEHPCNDAASIQVPNDKRRHRVEKGWCLVEVPCVPDNHRVSVGEESEDVVRGSTNW